MYTLYRLNQLLLTVHVISWQSLGALIFMVLGRKCKRTRAGAVRAEKKSMLLHNQ